MRRGGEPDLDAEEAWASVVGPAVIGWFGGHARDLPWRVRPLGARRDPYRVLVSEVMLQQTQAARVAERYGAFLERFPSVETLAAADEQQVLAAWTGLGYYRRARQLHAAARAVASLGAFPRTIEGLRALPGVGRYTAGAIASMAMSAREPVVDANVARVLLRVHGRERSASDADAQRWSWERAAELVEATRGVRRGAALLNEGLMELGAVVCVPRAPRCGACPLASACRARAEGTERRIPTPRAARTKPVIHCACVVARDVLGRVLVERRGESGLWAGLWQVPTIESTRPRGAEAVRRAMGLARRPVRGGAFVFQTTHRELRFVVWHAGGGDAPSPLRGEWREVGELAGLAMSSPQRRVLAQALDGSGT